MMESKTGVSTVRRKGGKSLMAKPNSRLMVKVPSKLRSALTGHQTSDVPATSATAANGVTSTKLVGTSASKSRCCCCCSSSRCADPHTSGTKSATLVPDPLLQQPVNLGSTNVRGIVKSLTDGTPEAKDLILNECDIIFECKVCRSLFRSFSNFLDHKRDFCQDHVCEKMVLFGSQSLRQELVARAPAQIPNGDTIHLIDSLDTTGPAGVLSPIQAQVPPLPSEVLKNGMQVPASRRTRSLDVCIQKLMHDKSRTAEQATASLTLTPITTTSQAVFQTNMDTIEEDADSAIHASDEGHDQDNESNALTEKSASDDSHESMASTTVTKPPVDEKPDEQVVDPPPSQPTARCGICLSEFVSNKTLRVHMKTLHASQRLIYPCPFCNLTFTQICNATRHMHQIHKKGKMDVKRLRDVIRMRARVAEEIVRSKSPEKHDSDPGFHEDMDMTPDADRSCAADPITYDAAKCTSTAEPEVTRKESKIECDDVDDSGPGHVCQGCNKFFPRIASKIGHEKVCESLKKPIRRKGKTSIQASDDSGYHPFDPIYDNEPLTITAVIKAGLQKVASTKKLKCYECPTLKFKNNVHLIRHAVAHMNEEIFACNNCVYQSLSRADIDSHAATIHGNEPIRGSPPNKIIITPSEIVAVRDEEFGCNEDGKVLPIRAVSAYNTTRLKAKKKEFKKKVKVIPQLFPMDPKPVTDQFNDEAIASSPLQKTWTAGPVPELPPPPPLMPQPPSLLHVSPKTQTDVIIPPLIVPALVHSVPEAAVPALDTAIPSAGADDTKSLLAPRILPTVWSKRKKKLNRLVPSLPVTTTAKPFGGQIKKRIQQAKKLRLKLLGDSSSLSELPATDPAIQPLKILIHKGVSSGKKITYAVTNVCDQTP